MTTRAGAGKQGNAIWVQCAACAGWFHVSEALLQARAAKLHCPHCHAQFQEAQAAQVARPC
ncbi:MAG: hypothetical protein IT514_02415 [Burkholderiales bacterium]|nr:hypothetical protein [Burkholderiales bacterium]